DLGAVAAAPAGPNRRAASEASAGTGAHRGAGPEAAAGARADRRPGADNATLRAGAVGARRDRPLGRWRWVLWRRRRFVVLTIVRRRRWLDFFSRRQRIHGDA